MLGVPFPDWTSGSAVEGCPNVATTLLAAEVGVSGSVADVEGREGV
jgi:hypothetical protein